mmetsp:Transcript_56435/g.165692  ORF Transcript_56435/g.165692 Transcript_56435/m.165692 type:complete len:582 (+) Transcript_56435:134-1879(+)
MRADYSQDNLQVFAEDREDGLEARYKPLKGTTHAEQGLDADVAYRSAGQLLCDRLDDFFKVSERGSDLTTEVRAGCISWMTMSYIMVVNPVILCQSVAGGQVPLSPESVMTATALSAAVGSLCAGLLADAPLGLMPGMGLNAYFAFGICHTFEVTWQQALSCAFVSGVVLVVLALLGICNWIVATILSEHLKKAITVAIGVFQALIGFQVMGLVVASPDTLITLGDFSLSNHVLYLAIGGFCFISALLVAFQLRGALLVGIWSMACAAWISGLSPPPTGIVAFPRFDSVLAVDFSAWDPAGDKWVGMVVGSAVLLFVALFDLAGVQYGLMNMAGLLSSDGQVPRSTWIFASAGLSTAIGALLGTSPVIIANESSAGIMEGAKTGLSACVVSLLFFVSAFSSPLLSAIPHVATAVPLVLIGAFMMSPCRGIDWDDLRVAIPSFLTVTVVPFTYSIHNGIIAGILMDLFLMALTKAPKDEDRGSPALLDSQAKRAMTPGADPVRFSSPHATMVDRGHRDRDQAEAARQLLTNFKLRTGSNGRSPQVSAAGGGAVEEADRKHDEALARALEVYLEYRDTRSYTL